MHLQACQLDYLPNSNEYWKSYTHLKLIDVRDNLLQTIPTAILCAPNLQSVLFAGNPLKDIPEYATYDWTTLRKYLVKLQKTAVRWRERKIIMIGPQQAGKSVFIFFGN